MSNIGKTQDDIEMLTLDQMRGAMRDMSAAKKSLGHEATIVGCMHSLEVVKQQLETTHEQMRTLIHLYGTLRDQFSQFQDQRVLELNVRVNGGSTTPEDMDDGPVS